MPISLENITNVHQYGNSNNFTFVYNNGIHKNYIVKNKNTKIKLLEIQVKLLSDNIAKLKTEKKKKKLNKKKLCLDIENFDITKFKKAIHKPVPVLYAPYVDAYVSIMIESKIEWKSDKKKRSYLVKDPYTIHVVGHINISKAVGKFVADKYPGGVNEEYNNTRKLVNSEYKVISKLEIESKIKDGIANIPMFKAKYTTYDNIKHNTIFQKDTGLCAYEAIEGRLKISKLEQLKIYNEYKYSENVDVDFVELTYEDGVTSNMVLYLCQKKDVSAYGLTIDSNLFVKHVGKNRNLPTLVWFFVEEHMYLIDDKDEIKSIVARYSERKTDSNITSSIFNANVETEEQSNVNKKFSENKILDNIDSKELRNHSNVNIIYPTNDLTEIFLQIFENYNFLPKTTCDAIKIKHIKLNTGPFCKKNIDLFIDPNYDTINSSYKNIKILCEQMSVPFTNQSVGTLSMQIKEIVIDKINRHKFSKTTRKSIVDTQENKCNVCKSELDKFEIDHIIPLALGGVDEIDNLQAICIQCHAYKTKTESDLTQYVKCDQIQSSYNSLTREIFSSNLMKKWAFIERFQDKEQMIKTNVFIDIEDSDDETISTVKKSIVKKLKKFTIDINKTRKNILYYDQYSWPIFTVMDEPKQFNQSDDIQCGVYYIETKNTYFPLRGNGWYFQPMIEYCLNNKIINKSDIKYELIPSVELKPTFFRAYVDKIYNNFNESSDELKVVIKNIVNAFIGTCNTNSSTKTSSIYCTSKVDVGYLCMKNVYEPQILLNENGTEVYKCNKIMSYTKDEDSRPIYLQILDIEAIELHKLSKLVEVGGGNIVSCNTDSITATYKNNKPIAISEYFWDKDCKVPKYKYEKKLGTQIERKAKYERNETFILQKSDVHIINDPMELDFEPLCLNIINRNSGINIDGIAGSGKTTFIRKMKECLDAKGLKYVCLAPTNKAARLINGMTIHMFMAKYKKSKDILFLDDIQYIFVDEISMVYELMYKYFTTIHRLKPHLKFILSGDFRQLSPVNDRVGDVDYKNSFVLRELTNFLRLELTECRRSDDDVYNLSLNVNGISPNQFKSDKIHFFNICFLNKTRHQVNKKCMDVKIKKAKGAKLAILNIGKLHTTDYEILLCKGIPIIARVNSIQMQIMNNELFTIEKVIKKTNTIIIQSGEKSLTFQQEDFKKYFELAFCITNYGSQGETFNEPYGIYDWNLMSKNGKYVAITRATSINQINFCN
jgi:hypothetical protein